MLSINILGLEKFQKAADNAKSLRERTRATILSETKLTAEEIVGTAKKRYLSGRPGLNVQTGNLRSRINSEVRDSGDVLDLSVGTNVIYGRIHEYGGTILPKKGPYLTFRSSSGRWAMVKSVTIPARPYLGPSISDNIDPFKRRIVSKLTLLANGMAS